MSTSDAAHPNGPHGFCGQCGAPLNAGDRFCGACGAPVEAAATAPAPVAGPAESRPAPARPTGKPPRARPAPETPRPEPVPPRTELPPTEPARGAGRGTLAFVATIANWGVGWLIGGGIGAFIFAELLFRHARIHGVPVPGISTTGTSSISGVALIDGVEPGGVFLWGLAGILGGVIAVAFVAIAGRQAVSADLSRHSLATLVWIVAIAALFSLPAPFLLPVAAAANGAWFGWQGEARERSALWHAGAWFLGAAIGLALLWIAAHA